jgi:hypothetical protein
MSMYHEDADMLFPMRAVAALEDLRGAAWKHLVERVVKMEEDQPDALAFGLMMIRLNGCLSCQSDSFRALHGCTACARQAVVRFRGNDADVLKLYEKACKDVSAYQAGDTETIARLEKEG